MIFFIFSCVSGIGFLLVAIYCEPLAPRGEKRNSTKVIPEYGEVAILNEIVCEMMRYCWDELFLYGGRIFHSYKMTLFTYGFF